MEVKPESKEENINTDPPVLPEATYKYIFPQISTHNRILVNILSFVDIHTLTKVAKMNRYSFKFLTNDDNLNKIQCWDLNEEEERKINNMIKCYFEDIPEKETT